jgi:hypothetical protein
MLEIILGIFSSSGVGSIVGLVGGYFNRKLDLQAKEMDIADKANERAHEINKLNAEKEYMLQEAAAKLQVATVEGDAKVEAAGYDAMAASYGFAATTSADGVVDKFSKIVRPLLTLFLFFFSIYVFYRINELVNQLGAPPDPQQVVKIWMQTIEWVLFQTGVCVGWWFAMRPGRQPKIG